MKTWVRKTLSVGVLAAGALLFGPGVAHADVRQNSYDNNGILNGAQLVAPVSVPVNIVGNAIGVAGEANAAGVGKNFTEGGKVTQNSYDNNGIANGLQGYLPVNVPINVVGNAVAVLGEANAAGAGVNGRKTESTTVAEHGKNDGHGWGNQNSWDNNGILNGAQIYAPVDVPINICGNALSLLGEGNAQAVCSNRHGHWTESAWGAKQNSYDNNGILNGAQVYAPISLPVNLAGNAVGVLGEGNAAAVAQNESAHGQKFGQDTHDNNGIGNGLQIAAPIHVPVNVCGNALGILGEANAAASCTNGGAVKGDGGHSHHHNGNGGDHDGTAADNGDDDYLGDGGAQGDGGTKYGSDTNAMGGRSAAKSDTEASPVGGLTKSVGGVGTTSLGGLDLLKTLG
jgi:ChpA-C